ncbi:FkbM family methyltransferase [Seonamhaeicola sediminis]|uniref:FkbM family methyltransferase n=1 Tax=Seonamhaeicola sediminis TaxID=2528206 RepID=A0A562YH73_9FLAO|nr:FkbM family methyltransferase [Seonamhaeicola sediminis]TWO34365.1 FkbM family methyltransferase [Seonamhaeicola sediminis]
MGKSNLVKRLFGNVNTTRGFFRLICADINRHYQQYNVKFGFWAPIKEASKAQQRGVETTLLNNAIKLCNLYKANRQYVTVFDIGANFGFLSLVWAQTICSDNGKVVAFEPNKQVCDSFKKSIKKNRLEAIITLENVVVGSENKTVELFLNYTTSNVLKPEKISDSVSIPMVTMDTYVLENNFDTCDLIKIDVDGIELDILQGCLYTLERFKPIFIVETNDNMEIIDFFMEKNYKVLDMSLKEYAKGTVLPPNIFCVPI